VDLKSAKGETDPRKKVTFPLGPDSSLGTSICSPKSAANPNGMNSVQLRKSAATAGDYQLAVDPNAKYGAVSIAKAPGRMSAATIDHSKSAEEVAGFIITYAGTKGTAAAESNAVVTAIQNAGGATMTVRSSGTSGRTHDKFEAVRSTTIDIAPSPITNVSTYRNKLITAILGTKYSLSNLPAGYGSSHSSLILRLTTVRRFAFKKDSAGKVVLDSKGFPLDNGDKTKWQVVIIGAVASKTNYSNPKLKTGILLDDLSGASGLARSTATLGSNCQGSIIAKLPMADIIWVIDESSSMSNKRQDIVNNANNFFSRALASGLDFRMGVTNVCAPTGSYKKCIGKFCSVASSNTSHDGGTDRFLLPTEQTIFSACIKNPPCYEGGNEYSLVNAKEAVKRHLPRATSSQSNIRKDSTLVIIVATDEIANSLSGLAYGSKPCPLDTTTQAKLDQSLQPYLNYFSGLSDPEAKAVYHIIGNVCGATTSSEMNHGHMTLAKKLGGQAASVAQKNLGTTLQLIIDSVIGAASPTKFVATPVSATITVSLDGTVIKRSRTNGFDYYPTANSLSLINVNYKKGSVVITGYRRWK